MIKKLLLFEHAMLKTFIGASITLLLSTYTFAGNMAHCHYGNKSPSCINKSIPINEATFKFTYDDLPDNYVSYYGKINQNGYVPMSHKSIDRFISNTGDSLWFSNGIRYFKPYEKKEGFWSWKIEPTKYRNLTVIGVYRGVCDDYISGEDRCGVSIDGGFIFKETEAQVKSQIKPKGCLIIFSAKMHGKKHAIVGMHERCLN